MRKSEKINLDAKDISVAAFMDFIEERLLSNTKILASKAEILFLKYNSWCVSKPVKCEFTELTIYRSLVQPYARGNALELTSNQCTSLVNFAYDLTRDRTLSQVELDNIKNFTSYYKSMCDASQPTIDQNAQELYNKLFNYKNTLQCLGNTHWLVFERTGDPPVKNAEWGISIGLIKLMAEGDYMIVEMDTNISGKNLKLQGLAICDFHKTYLHIDLISSGETEKKYRMALRLNEAHPESQTIMLGHFTYHSKRFQHLLSKTIVLQKVDEITSYQLGECPSESEEYQNIPAHIRQFLYPREMNRLSLPGKTISDKSELIKFLKRKKGQIVHIAMRHFIDTYSVFYVRDQDDLREDSLIIRENDDALAIEAKYIHKPDIGGKREKQWVGEAYITNAQQSVSIKLSIQKDIELHTKLHDDDPILLTFWIPGEKLEFARSECFMGVVSGLEDQTKGPISLLCLVVRRKEGSRFTDNNIDKIRKFFAGRTLELLPENPMYSLDMLREDIK